MFDRSVRPLIRELFTVDRLAPGSISVREVTT
eukprot:COSAG02_NODE_30438_length_551_cov_0.820796_1_plen_31_part_10